MTATHPPHRVRFYFSLRSPYSWLATERLARLPPGRIAWDFVPTWPRPDRDGNVVDPVGGERNMAYLIHDVLRQSQALGLAMQPPAAIDCDWVRPHAAWLLGEAEGRPFETLLALFRARWTQRRALDDDDALRAVAAAAGLDPDAFLAAADDPERAATLDRRMQHARADGLRGVPFFVFGAQRFWGNDRVDWLLRALDEAEGRPVPDLCADPLGAVWRADGR